MQKLLIGYESNIHGLQSRHDFRTEKLRKYVRKLDNKVLKLWVFWNLFSFFSKEMT